MNHIEGYQTKVKAQKCKDNYTCKPYRLVEINFLMDCPFEYYKTRKVKTKMMIIYLAIICIAPPVLMYYLDKEIN